MKKLLAALFTVGLALAYCADIPVNDAGPQAITSNASLGASCSGLIGQSTAYFVLSGTAGPLDATVVNGTNPTDSAVIYDKSGTTHAQPFTPTAGVYYRVYPVGSGTKVSIIPDSTWGAQSAAVDIRCTAATEGFPPSTSGGGGGNSTIVAPTNCGPNTAVCTYDVHSPLPTVAPGGALAAVPVNASAVPYSPTNPFPVSTASPAATLSPGPYSAHNGVLMGSNGVAYLDTVPDTTSTSAPTSGPGTALIVSGQVSRPMYLWETTYTGTGTNTGTDTYELVYGSGATCGTGTKTIVPATAASGSISNGGSFILYGPVNSSGNPLYPGIAPATKAYPIPGANPANNLCGITTTVTAINGFFSALYTIP